MRDPIILLVHLIATLARLMGRPGLGDGPSTAPRAGTAPRRRWCRTCRRRGVYG